VLNFLSGYRRKHLFITTCIEKYCIGLLNKNKIFYYFGLFAGNDDAASLVSNASCIKSKRCSNYTEFNALFSFTIFNQLGHNLKLI